MAAYTQWVVTAVKTGTYTAALGETVRADPSGGTFTITLPTVGSTHFGRQVKVKNQTSSTTTITIAADSGHTIDGASSVTIATARGSLTFEYDGAGDWMLT